MALSASVREDGSGAQIDRQALAVPVEVAFGATVPIELGGVPLRRLAEAGETGQLAFDHRPHGGGRELVEVAGAAAADLGKAGSVGQKHRRAEVHSLDRRQAEAFRQRWEQERLAVLEQPRLGGFADAEQELHVWQSALQRVVESLRV